MPESLETPRYKRALRAIKPLLAAAFLCLLAACPAGSKNASSRSSGFAGGGGNPMSGGSIDRGGAGGSSGGIGSGGAGAKAPVASGAGGSEDRGGAGGSSTGIGSGGAGAKAPAASGAGGSETTVDGTLDGKTFEAKTAMSGTDETKYVVVGLADVDASCAMSGNYLMQPNEHTLQILIQAGSVDQPSTTPVTQGKYTVTDGVHGPRSNIAVARALVTDDMCESTPHDSASGTVNIDSIDAATITGTFSIGFQNGDMLSGSFHAPRCKTWTTPFDGECVM
jgi:hypothetical protein